MTNLLGPENQEGALAALVLPCQAQPDSHRVGARQDALAELTLPEGHSCSVRAGGGGLASGLENSGGQKWMGIVIHGVCERVGRVERDVNSDLSLFRWEVFPRCSRGWRWGDLGQAEQTSRLTSGVTISQLSLFLENTLSS